MADVVKLVDAIYKQQRLPIDSEMDTIMVMCCYRNCYCCYLQLRVCVTSKPSPRFAYYCCLLLAVECFYVPVTDIFSH